MKFFLKAIYIFLFVFCINGKNSFAIDVSHLEKNSLLLSQEVDRIAKRAGSRWSHARELLGKHYHKSVVQVGEHFLELDDVIEKWLNHSLKKDWKKLSKKLTKVILEESEKHGFDPIFLMAVIQSESSFNPKVRGPVGEIGLMQITPRTGQWLSKKFKLRWKGLQTLEDPFMNIQIGTTYLAYLRDYFHAQSQLYVAAYNMGPRNVKKAIQNKVWPKKYVERVMNHYISYYQKIKKEMEMT